MCQICLDPTCDWHSLVGLRPLRFLSGGTVLKPLSGNMSLFFLLSQKPGKEQQGVAVANRSLRTFLLNSGSTEPAAWSPDLGRLLSTLNSLSKGADGRLFFQMKPSRSQGAHRATPLQIPVCSWWSGQAVESHMPAASASPLPDYLDPA